MSYSSQSDASVSDEGSFSPVPQQLILRHVDRSPLFDVDLPFEFVLLSPKEEEFQQLLDLFDCSDLDVVHNDFPNFHRDHGLYYINMSPFVCGRRDCVFETPCHLVFLQHLHNAHYGVPLEDLEQSGINPKVKDEFESVRDSRKGFILKPFYDNNDCLLRIPLQHPIEQCVQRGLEFTMVPVSGYPIIHVPPLSWTFGVLPSFLDRYEPEEESEKEDTPDENERVEDNDDDLAYAMGEEDKTAVPVFPYIAPKYRKWSTTSHYRWWSA